MKALQDMFDVLVMWSSCDAESACEVGAPILYGMAQGAGAEDTRRRLVKLMELGGEALEDWIDRELMHLYATYMKAPTAFEAEHAEVGNVTSVLDMLVRRNERYVHAEALTYCERLGLSSEDALDVAAEVFIRVMQRGNTYERSSSGRFRGWLRTIARNLIVDLYRKRQRRRTDSDADRGVGSTEGVVAVSEMEDTEQLLAENELTSHQTLMLVRRLYLAALDRMKLTSPRRHEAWSLMVGEGLSSDEAAKVTGTAAPTLRRHKRLAQEQLSGWMIEMCQEHQLTAQDVMAVFDRARHPRRG